MEVEIRIEAHGHGAQDGGEIMFLDSLAQHCCVVVFRSIRRGFIRVVESSLIEANLSIDRADFNHHRNRFS